MEHECGKNFIIRSQQNPYSKFSDHHPKPKKQTPNLGFQPSHVIKPQLVHGTWGCNNQQTEGRAFQARTMR